LCFGGTVLLVALAFGDRTALAVGPKGVEVYTALARHKAGWADVAGIGFEQAHRAETLTVRLKRDMGEKKVRLSLGLLEQDRAEIARLLDGAGRPPAAPAERPASPPQVRGGFGRRRI